MKAAVGVLLFLLIGYTAAYFMAAAISRVLIGGEWVNIKIYSIIRAFLLPLLIISQIYFLLSLAGFLGESGPGAGFGILDLLFKAPTFWALALLLMILLRVHPSRPSGS